MELALCSEKVKLRSLNPKYLGDEQECDQVLKLHDHFFCHFHFPNSNGEITVYGKLTNAGNSKVIQEAKYFTNIKDAPLAFVDAMIELSHQRDAHALGLLKMREIDAFLRTKNSEPSFPDEGINLVRYYELLKALAHSISRNIPQTSMSEESEANLRSPTIEEYQPHSVKLFDQEILGQFFKLDLQTQLQLVNEILRFHVRPLLQRDGGDVEAVHILENLVVINFMGNCGTCGMSLTTTMDFIKKVLRTELFEPSLDIISDN